MRLFGWFRKREPEWKYVYLAEYEPPTEIKSAGWWALNNGSEISWFRAEWVTRDQLEKHLNGLGVRA
jgi:hypothetical protein